MTAQPFDLRALAADPGAVLHESAGAADGEDADDVVEPPINLWPLPITLPGDGGDAVPGPAGLVPPAGRRSLRTTPAARIKTRPIKWLWDERLGLGTFDLLGGREGIGKSTWAFDLAAKISRGTLPGIYFGKPKGVIICASEDPWEQVIVPRLIAAGADLSRVYRVDVVTADNIPGVLNLPADIPALGELIAEHDAALVILDPLLSRLDAALDTHKDAEVRRALEPLVALADRTNSVVLGLIHVNKGMSTDPLSMLMASRAFPAVARAVLFMLKDPDDDGRLLLGEPKNNLGRVDLPTLSLTIEGVRVGELDGDVIWATRIRWGADIDRGIRDLVQSASEGPEDRTATGEAAGWMTDYLESVGGYANSVDVKREGVKAGHALRALERARSKACIASVSHGFPRQALWCLPGRYPGESGLTGGSGGSGGTVAPVPSVSPVTPVVSSPARARETERLHLRVPFPEPAASKPEETPPWI
ncbi:MAG: AAA family ATPase [Candidatus Limnocylindrales bacterium]|jgi:hypothetical protein